MKRYAATITGIVQGVGFRWNVLHLAESLGVTGWVRNELDGSVVLEAQGNSLALLRFFEKLPRCARWAQVEHIARTPLPPVEGERAFQIRG